MWEFVGKLVAITLAVNISATWVIVLWAGTRRQRQPWPDRENLS